MEEEIGIENIKEVLSTFLEVGILGYQSYKDDNKIDTGEAIKLAFKIPSIWGAIKDIKPAIVEAKNLNPDELSELMAFLLEKLESVDK